MSNRLKGKALPQTDQHRKPKNIRKMIERTKSKPIRISVETRGRLYGGGIILACLIGLALWIVTWLAFC
jgi:hypothetical protein